MNIRSIRTAADNLMKRVEEAIERKEDKDEMTEHDEGILSALQEYAEALENALEELNAVYED